MTRPEFQMADYLYAAAETAPDRPCFIFSDGSERSFAETEERVNRLGSAMLASGVRRGDKVAILAINSAEYCEVMFACIAIGACFTPQNYRLRLDELRVLIGSAKPTAMFASSDYLEQSATLAEEVASLTLLISFDGGDERHRDYEEFVASGQNGRPAYRTTDDDLACLVYTSGSTGLPKGALHSHRSFRANYNNTTTNFELGWDGAGYTGSPFYHIAGYGIVFANLVTRNATLVIPQFDPELVLECLGRGNINHCLFIPTMITMLLDHPHCANTDFSGLELILYGGMPIEVPMLKRAMRTFGCDFVQLFGAGTEVSTQSTLSKLDHRKAVAGQEKLLGSIGKPRLAVRFRIVDGDGHDVPLGEVGEIITFSAQAMLGYMDMPEETAECLRDGWFWGGDLGYRDEDGYIYLAGRSKDIIIRGGSNVYPSEVETVLAEVPGVKQVAVLGEPDTKWGEVVIACIVATDDYPGEAAAIEHCKSRLATYKTPIRIEKLDRMPMTGSAKVSKPDLREAGRDGRAKSFIDN